MQAALTTGKARKEAARERLSGAQVAQGQMRQEIGGLRLTMEQAIRECRSASSQSALFLLWSLLHSITSNCAKETQLRCIKVLCPVAVWCGCGGA
jgi:hypothetical protein